MFDGKDKNLIIEMGWENGERVLRVHIGNVVLVIFYLIALGIIIHSCAVLI